MALIKGKNIGSNEIYGSLIRFLNGDWLKWRNAANNADVNAMKVNASDRIEFASAPQVTVDPIAGNDLVRKSFLSNYLGTSEKGTASGLATLDANSLIPIAQIPPAAIERLVIVADQAARYALTTATVQNGDTVKETDTGLMFFVKDDTNLNGATGYAQYTAGAASSVAWSGVTGTPTTLAGYGITDYASAAKSAAVSDAIVDGVTDVAPSQNAVYDALAGKTNTGHAHAISDVTGLTAALSGKADAFSYGKENFTLAAGDITAQYIDLAQVVKANSVAFLTGGVEQIEGTDYTVSLTGGAGSKTRITFAGDIATGGAAALVATDKVHVKYSY